MGTPQQQLPEQKIELDGWIKGHQLGLCLKIFKICLNLSLLTENSSFQCREVFYFHVFSQFCLVLLYISDLGESIPIHSFEHQTQKHCIVLLCLREKKVYFH